MAYLFRKAEENFNPRPHTKGDFKNRLAVTSTWHFNPRPHTKGDRCLSGFARVEEISILAPTQRATTASGPRNWSSSSFQSSPPHKGRPVYHRSTNIEWTISILAPTQRATRPNSRQRNPDRISILAPTQRATFVCIFFRAPGNISILAPTQRATRGQGQGLCREHISILAPTQRATFAAIDTGYAGVFQSSPPHKGRQKPTRSKAGRRRFQSSPPHKGRRDLSISGFELFQISILAPTQRAT